jgi:hypothetical protein
MEWIIVAAVAVALFLQWKGNLTKGSRNVAVVLANALRNNHMRVISNDYDARRIARARVNEDPPRFNHRSIGGVEIRSTAIDEAFFIPASRIDRNHPPHINYEMGCVAFLLLLTDRENVAAYTSVVSIDWNEVSRRTMRFAEASASALIVSTR